MALTDQQWADALADIVARLIAGEINEAQAASELAAATADWPTRTLSNADLAARVSRFLARLNGLLVGAGPPDAGLGELNTYYFDSTAGLFYGPKAAGGWGAPTFSLVGPTGPAGTITSATATTGAPGSDAGVTLGGTPSARTLGFTIPRGDPGADATITGVTVTTGEPGSDAAVEMGGSPGGRTFEFTIPRGSTGLTPALSIGAVETGAPGSSADVTITGTVDEPVLNLTLPRGDKGDVGPVAAFEIGTVTTGAPGSSAAATITGTAAAPFLNLSIPRGNTGDPGAASWTPVFATAVDGERRVQRIVDWTGGGGAKPATGLYVGPAGLVSDIAQATNVRGAAGAGSGDMIAANNLSDLTDVAQARTNLGISDSATIGIDEVDGLQDELDARYTKPEADAAMAVKADLVDGKVPAGQLPDIDVDFDPQQALAAFIAAYEGD